MGTRTSIHTVRWGNSLANYNIDLHLITMHTDTRKNLVSEKVTIHILKDSAPLGYFTNILPLSRLLNKIKPDLLHVFYATGYGTLGTFCNFHPLGISVLGSDIYDFPKRSFIHKILLQYNLKKAKYLFSTSKDMAKEASLYTKNKITIVPFGIDINKFKPLKVNSIFSDKSIVIGTVKTLETIYGIDNLIYSFAKIKKQLPLSPLKLLIVGSGSIKKELTSIVSRLNINDSVVFINRVPHEEVPIYLNMLSIYVSLSIRESFGVAALEAQACEIPVVVSNVGGFPEVVENGKTGFIVESGNLESTTLALSHLVLDEKKRKNMGKSGRKRVKNMYSWEKNSIEIMINIYAQIKMDRF